VTAAVPARTLKISSPKWNDNDASAFAVESAGANWGNLMAVHALAPAGRRPAVLVVEDEVLIRLDLSDHLRDFGYEVIEAGNADEALECLAATAIDVVVTDVRMPGSMDGIQLAHLLHDERPHIGVIVVSGHADADQVPAGVPVVTKPFNMGDLIDLVGSRLQRQH
jgi:DNA-binding NtrC family response regulator